MPSPHETVTGQTRTRIISVLTDAIQAAAPQDRAAMAARLAQANIDLDGMRNIDAGYYLRDLINELKTMNA